MKMPRPMRAGGISAGGRTKTTWTVEARKKFVIVTGAFFWEPFFLEKPIFVKIFLDYFWTLFSFFPLILIYNNSENSHKLLSKKSEIVKKNPLIDDDDWEIADDDDLFSEEFELG